MPDADEPLYLIGVAAKLCEMHPQTLRTYERLELVVPVRVGTKNRMYSQNDIDRLKQIQRFTQELGVNLAGVEVIFKLLREMEEKEKEHKSEVERLKNIIGKQNEIINKMAR